jgi:signal transduction histidine kinase
MRSNAATVPSTSSAQPGEHGEIAINMSDDGVGIPEASLSRIYDPFFTTQLGAGGSGLGVPHTTSLPVCWADASMCKAARKAHALPCICRWSPLTEHA